MSKTPFKIYGPGNTLRAQTSSIGDIHVLLNAHDDLSFTVTWRMYGANIKLWTRTDTDPRFAYATIKTRMNAYRAKQGWNPI